jgi:hypothetical protein
MRKRGAYPTLYVNNILYRTMNAHICETAGGVCGYRSGISAFCERDEEDDFDEIAWSVSVQGFAVEIVPLFI